METSTNINHAESDENKDLLKLLEGFPLIIIQSTAFMRETRLTATKYLNLYRKEWKKFIYNVYVPLRSYPNNNF
jgi:hypothetical protein